jgi:hypothetical protein
MGNNSIIEPGFHLVVPNLVYKFQTTCLKKTYIIEWKLNVGRTERHTGTVRSWVKCNGLDA